MQPPLYIPQRSSWDCGLACVCMALSALRAQRPMNTAATDELLTSERRTVWTVDLLLLLHRLAPPSTAITLTTTCAGAPPPSHFALPFYAHAPGDAERVPAAFASAAAAHLDVREERAPLAPVLAELAARTAVYVALVDLRLLTCTGCCEVHTARAAARAAVGGAPSPGSTYAGHYVLLFGYSAASGRLAYYDPAPDASPLGCECDAAVCERAWAEAGTDFDLIRVAAAA